MRRTNAVYGAVQVDMSEPLARIDALAAAGEDRPSITAYLVACLGRTVATEPEIQALRDWRGRCVVYPDVDAMVMVEVPSPDGPVPLGLVMRAVHRRTVSELSSELRSAAARPATMRSSTLVERALPLPLVVWRVAFAVIARMPALCKRMGGTVGLSAVGMHLGRGGWGFATLHHSVEVLAGGIAERPVAVNGRIEIRPVLDLTVAVDHDIVDGAPATRFTARLLEAIESGEVLGRPVGSSASRGAADR